MYIATAYQTDNEFVLGFAVPLYIGYNGVYSQQEIATDPLIPAVLLTAITWLSRNPCQTKQITPRFVDLTLASGDTLRISYPFKPGTNEWFAFWEQLQSPDIISVKGFGEKVTDKFLKTSLGLP